MKTLYKLYIDCGRMGSLDGLFIADARMMKALIDSKKEVYFGEVLGKHSEVSIPIEESYITEVTSDPSVLSIVTEYSLEQGFDPFEYIELYHRQDFDSDEEYEEYDWSFLLEAVK